MTPEQVVQSVLDLSDGMSRPVYRGQAEADWKLRSGAVRRLEKAYGDDYPKDANERLRLVKHYQREQLIRPMRVIDGADLSELQRLSVLQHHGAATDLLDFTENALVALWFACSDLSECDGKVFVFDIDDHHVALNGRLLDPSNATLDIVYNATQDIVYYEPDRSLGPRIIAQQSVFVICGSQVPDPHVRFCVVPERSKEQLRIYLARLGLSEAALFGDVTGLATAHAASKPLQIIDSPSPELHRDRGNRAYQDGRYEDALAAYEAFATELPNVAQPYCLKGDVLAALGRFEEADSAYTTAIGNLDRPVSLGGQAVTNEPVSGDVMASLLHFNRGNVRAATHDHLDAVKDFDKALQHGRGPNAHVLGNRGNSKFALNLFVEAYEDFEAAWSQTKKSNAALAMGNCKVMTGEFDEALQWFLSGNAEEPKATAGHCGSNAKQVKLILEALGGSDYRIRVEEPVVLVEIVGTNGHVPVSGKGPFRMAGNRGNSGNIPSGMVTASGAEGYPGAAGYSVVIVPPERQTLRTDHGDWPFANRRDGSHSRR